MIDTARNVRISADLFLHGQREKLVALSASHALPTIYPWREYVTVGGMMSYGPNLLDASRLIGVYSGRILRGAEPATLPVEQHDRVHFAINLRTSKTLGLSIQPIPTPRLRHKSYLAAHALSIFNCTS